MSHAVRTAALLLAAVVALIACSPQVKAPEDSTPHATLLFEIDAGELRHAKLVELSTMVREVLRKQPMITVGIDGRKIDGDYLFVRPSKPSDRDEAMKRILAIGDTEGWPDPLVIEVQGDGALDVMHGEKTFSKIQADTLLEVVEIAKRRLDGVGLRDAVVQPKGDNQIEVQVPTETDPKPIIDLLTSPGVLTFNLVDAEANIADYEVGVERNGRIALPDDSMGGEPQVIYTDAVVAGSDLSGAQPGFDESNRPNIQFQLQPGGAAKLGRATSQSIGKQIAIVLDNRIVSAPTIQSPIMSGSGQITGSFTVEEAERIAVMLRTGALPVKLKLLESSGFKNAQ